MKQNKKMDKNTVLIVLIIILITIMLVNMFQNYIAKIELEAFKTQTVKEVKKIGKDVERIKETMGLEDEEVNFIGLDTKYEELSKIAKEKLKLDEDGAKLEIDLNNDEKLDEIKLIIEDSETEKTSILYNDKKISSGIGYKDVAYIVDIDNSDDYLDLVILSLEENDNFFHFDVFKNDGQELKKIEYNSTKIISGINYNNRFYLNEKKEFFVLSNAEVDLDKIVTDIYYEIDGIKLSEKRADINKINKEKFKMIEFAYNSFFSDEKEINMNKILEYNSLEPEEEFTIIEWVDHSNGLKIQLEDGRMGYIYPVQGYLAG